MLCLLGAVTISCSNFDMRTKEESEAVISDANVKLEKNNQKILEQIQKTNLKNSNNELSLFVQDKFLNTLTQTYSNQKEDDIKFSILPKKSFYTETKRVLGIQYNNYIDIDTGFISLNIKKFAFTNLSSNKAQAVIELAGTGNLRVSGKHTGIPGSFSPDISLYLKEDITFNVKNENEQLVLIVEPKSIELKSKFTITIFDYKLPYSQSFKLNTKDIIKPIKFPLSFQNYVELPKPEDKRGSNKLISEKYEMLLKNTTVRVEQGSVNYNADIDLKKKH